MDHRLFKIDKFEIVGPYTLRVHFDDGTNRVINFLPILKGVIYGPLRDIDAFNSVQIDSEIGTIFWPNGADFDPATLHDWPKYEDEMKRMAMRWEEKDNKVA